MKLLYYPENTYNFACIYDSRYGRWNIYGTNFNIVWIKLDHFQSNAFELAVLQIASILFSPQCLSRCYIFMTYRFI